MRVKSLGGYPIEQYTSPNVGGRMTGHKGIVLHIAQGTYRGTISWQMNPDQRYADGKKVTTTSTWTVGKNRGEWAQMADSDIVAWAQRSGSYDWLSIELAGYAPEAPTVWQVEACARLLVWAHRTYGIPVAIADNPSERGLGHHSMDREWLGEEWGHDACPGTGVIGAKATILRRAQAILTGEDDDMELSDRLPLTKDVNAPSGYTLEQVFSQLHASISQGRRVLGPGQTHMGGVPLWWAPGGWVRGELTALDARLKLRDEAILAAVLDNADRDTILARVDQRAAELRTNLLNDFIAALPDGTDPVTREELSDALRSVFGSLDNTPTG